MRGRLSLEVTMWCVLLSGLVMTGTAAADVVVGPLPTEETIADINVSTL